MEGLKIDLTKCTGFFSDEEFATELKLAGEMAILLDSGKGRGNEYTGWLDLPVKIDEDELARIKNAAKRIQDQAEYFINIGIGGSYLGARAVDDALYLSDEGTRLLYAGNGLSGTEMVRLLDKIKDGDIALNVVSKSGTTTEPAIAFRILKDYLYAKYGSDAPERIYAVTDASRGAVKSICDREGYERFVIPDDVGGRYSVLTPVGLLPLAAAGADIDALLEGASAQYYECKVGKNACMQYAAARNLLYKKGFTTEIMAVYESSLRFFAEWWKQLYGESEGKENKGIFPASVVFSADLHSMGQYIQQGIRNVFESVIFVENPPLDISIPDTGSDEDGLAYLAGENMNYVNKVAMEATVNAHVSGGVPNMIIKLPKQDAYNLGKMIYFFEYACAVSGYMLGVNPFDQPGVEAYKTE
ncbi:MAG: glucose-6-phosphate isomerase, partial [Clostridia bacterium]|nr:glucose-6-phosphate isomerase [Clostridia bacterium]